MSDAKDERPKQEIERRMQNAIQRALNTPPKPFTPPAKGSGKGKPSRKKPKPQSDRTSN